MAETGANLFAALSEDRRAAFLTRVLAARDLLIKAQKARSADTCASYLESAFGR